MAAQLELLKPEDSLLIFQGTPGFTIKPYIKDVQSMSDVDITHEAQGSKGRYIAKVEGREGGGEMTYSIAGEHRIIIDHTGVDEDLKGLGVGRSLAVHAVQDAREKAVRSIPLCPFFKAQAQRHTAEWSDVVEGLD